MKLLILLQSIIFLLLISVIYFIYKIYNTKKIKKNNIEKFQEKKINFLTKEQNATFLYNDTDNYIKNLTGIDLFARKVKNNNIYKNKCINCATNFNQHQINIITQACIEADKYLSSYNYLLNGNDIAIIDWNIALTTNYNNFEYEEGLPHTRENIIFLSNKLIPNTISNSLINTLIHEKIHIYQRYNYDILENIINKMGYTKTSFKNIKQRSNPDLNNSIYINKNNEKLSCLYKSDKPNGINDVTCLENNNLFEHPYELLAYTIANAFNISQLEKYIKI
tara:strand:+ start:7981 stop:8817 length:837 start_codon:yes stop_codon:yes gene_type:complete